MKNKKGFTLVELLAVIAVLGIIMVIVGVNISNAVNESKTNSVKVVSKEISKVASAYLITEPNTSEIFRKDSRTCISIDYLINQDYLKKDATDPFTLENNIFRKDRYICFDENYRFKKINFKELQNKNALLYDKFAIYKDYYSAYNAETPTIPTDDINKTDKLENDINGDGIINCEDAKLILNHDAGKNILTEEQQKKADLNKDNVVDVGDGVLFLRKYGLSCKSDYNYDTNGDGKTDCNDVNFILNNYINNTEVTNDLKDKLDLDSDGNVNISDAIKLVNTNKLVCENIIIGDVNSDGYVNEKDFDTLNKYLAGWSDIEINNKQSDLDLDDDVDDWDAVLLGRLIRK